MMDARTDLRDYPDNELVLQVNNTEHLYLARQDKGFICLLQDLFLFTDEQLDELVNDLSYEMGE